MKFAQYDFLLSLLGFVETQLVDMILVGPWLTSVYSGAFRKGNYYLYYLIESRLLFFSNKDRKVQIRLLTPLNVPLACIFDSCSVTESKS